MFIVSVIQPVPRLFSLMNFTGYKGRCTWLNSCIQLDNMPNQYFWVSKEYSVSLYLTFVPKRWLYIKKTTVKISATFNFKVIRKAKETELKLNRSILRPFKIRLKFLEAVLAFLFYMNSRKVKSKKTVRMQGLFVAMRGRGEGKRPTTNLMLDVIYFCFPFDQFRYFFHITRRFRYLDWTKKTAANNKNGTCTNNNDLFKCRNAGQLKLNERGFADA